MTAVLVLVAIAAALVVGTIWGRKAVALLYRMRFKPTGRNLLIGLGVMLALALVVAIVTASLRSGMAVAVAGAFGAGVVALGLVFDGDRTQLRSGFASSWRVYRTMGTAAMRRSVRVTRPSLGGALRLPDKERGICVGRSRRPATRQRIYASYEDVVLTVGPPRMGKTALFGNAVIDAPGATVVTSTKVDIYRQTAPVRSSKGPVYLLNPEGMAGEPSTLKWSPITGCDEPAVAIERAAYMIAGAPSTGDVENRHFWEGSNAKVLRCYLYAAAVAGLTMADVRNWVNDPDDKEALRILMDHPETPAGWVEALRQVLMTPAEKTRESIYLTLQLAFEFMADPAVASAVLPESGEAVFDVRKFLEEHGTLYLLGARKSHGGMGPLFSALTGHIFEEAKRLSQSEHCAAGRLDPPLVMVLDEVANICPVPLAQWTSDAGGRGIPLFVAIQSPSQLRERWGEHDAETVWNNANVTLVFGGLKVDKDLASLSELCGERDERIYSTSWGSGRRSGSYTLRRVPVMAPNQIREIGDGQVLVLRRNTEPFMAKIRPVWRRPDVRAARRAAARAKAPAKAQPVKGPKLEAVVDTEAA